jgi:Protein of unknown function (DUF4238)
VSDEPKDHHYVPAFYLRAWEDASTSKLMEFRKVTAGGEVKVVSKPVSAQSTGYQKHLYSRETATPGQLDHSFESEFLKYLDEDASKVIRRILAGDLAIEREGRKDWARFLVALMMRAPEDIAAYNAGFDDLWNKPAQELEDWYDRVRLRESPATLAALLSTMPKHEREEQRVKALGEVLEQNRAIGLLDELKWSIRSVDTAKLPLMTSDRPVVTNFRLGFPDGFLFMPLSPKMIFVAQVGRAPELDVMRDGTDNEVMKFCNRAVVMQAQHYVWASTDRHEAYVRRWIGTSPQRRFNSVERAGLHT